MGRATGRKGAFGRWRIGDDVVEDPAASPLPRGAATALIRRIVGTAAVVLGFAYIGRALIDNWNQVRDTLSWMDAPWIGLHLFAVLVFFCVAPLIWSLVLRSCGIRASRRTEIVSTYLPNLYKYVPGKVWAVASRVELVACYAPAARTRAAAATAVGYLIEILGAVPFLLLGACLIPSAQLHVASRTVALAGGLSVLLFLLAVLLPLTLSHFGRAVRRPFFGGLRPRRVLVLVLSSIAYWTIYAGSGMLLARGLGVTDFSTALLSGCVLVAAWLLGFVSLLTPGGIGVREGVMALLLTPLLGPAKAAVMPLVARLSWTVAEFTGAALALWIRPRKR